MISLQQYLLDPCGTTSIPYWKYKSIAVPQNMMIVHQRELTDELLLDHRDEPYFRLYHDLKNVRQMTVQGAKFATVSGKIRDPSDPERLYRKCGFVGTDIWHILTPKD